MRVLVVLLLLGGALAGCLGVDDVDDDQASPRPAVVSPDGSSAHGNAKALPPWTMQLCDHGYAVVTHASTGVAVSRAGPADRDCNFRVTKPLDDPSRFDWTSQHGPANEVSMAVNPTNPLNVVGGAKDYTVSYISDTADCGQYTVWNGHFWSMDGGRTWNNDLIPGFPGDPRDSPLKGNLCNTDPVSVFDSDGTYWHNGLNYRGAREDVGDPMNPAGNGGLITGSQIFFARSVDAGASFDRITFGSYGQNDPGIFNDKNWLAVDPESDHMIHTWTNFYTLASAIEYIESFDGGATWTHPAPLSAGGGVAGVTGGSTGESLPNGQFSMPQYDSNGDVWVIWFHGTVPPDLHAVITRGIRADAAAPTVFEPSRPAVPMSGSIHNGDGCIEATEFRASQYPVLAIDTSGGPFNDRKYIAWPAGGSAGGEVLVSYSDDGFAWSEPAEATQGLANDQFMPWIDVGPDGSVHIAYYDCSMGDAEEMTMGYVHSLDGGATWSAPAWVGHVPFHGDLAHHQSGAPFIGDYIAVDASDSGVHFFWADTRNGRSDVYSSTIIRDAGAMGLYAPELMES